MPGWYQTCIISSPSRFRVGCRQTNRKPFSTQPMQPNLPNNKTILVRGSFSMCRCAGTTALVSHDSNPGYQTFHRQSGWLVDRFAGWTWHSWFENLSFALHMRKRPSLAGGMMLGDNRCTSTTGSLRLISIAFFMAWHTVHCVCNNCLVARQEYHMIHTCIVSLALAWDFAITQ
jgi:hypothetical protein